MREESPYKGNNFSIKNSKNGIVISQKTVMNLGKMYNKDTKIREGTLQRFIDDEKEKDRNGNN
jgi:hypothetical protein